MDIVGRIGGIPLFAGLERTELEKIAQICLPRTAKKGAAIFTEGRPADGFYVAVSGRVKIFKVGADGKEQILHLFGPGEPFGEVPVFEGKNFPAHAQALTDTSLLFFPRKAFVELTARNPDLALGMLACLSRRLRYFTMLVDDLSLKEVPGRLAAHLLLLSRSSGGTDTLDIEIPKNQLASLLGTTPETLSRVLTKMTKQGLIAYEGTRVSILDREELRSVAEGMKKM
jgi:CRP/FNR family transcriptional regulator